MTCQQTTCLRNQAPGSVSNSCTPELVADVNACIPTTCAPKDQTCMLLLSVPFSPPHFPCSAILDAAFLLDLLLMKFQR